MRYAVLATGFDGTLARDGRCSDRSKEALRALSASGRKLVLVTSRELRSLLEVFPEATEFDYLVAENGAVTHRPAARESAILARAPSELLIQELRRRNVEPLSVGSVSVTTAAKYCDLVVELLGKLKLDCYTVDNGELISILPVGVSKASGVQYALEDLALSRHNLVAIADAENDLPLLDWAEHGVALANASTVVKDRADRVSRGAFEDGFLEVAAELLDSDLVGAPTQSKVVLGRRGTTAVTLPTAQCALLLSGPAASGKWLYTSGIIAQYTSQGYQCCLLTTQRREIDAREAFVTHGDESRVPRIADLLGSLAQPECSVNVNLAALGPAARATLVIELLEQLAKLQSKTGRPHLLVFDEAEALLDQSTSEACRAVGSSQVLYIATQPDLLPSFVRQAVDVVVCLAEPSIALASFQDANSRIDVERETLDHGQALVWFRRSGTAPLRVELDALASSLRPAVCDSRIDAATQRRSSRVGDNEPALP